MSQSIFHIVTPNNNVLESDVLSQSPVFLTTYGFPFKIFLLVVVSRLYSFLKRFKDLLGSLKQLFRPSLISTRTRTFCLNEDHSMTSNRTETNSCKGPVCVKPTVFCLRNNLTKQCSILRPYSSRWPSNDPPGSPFFGGFPTRKFRLAFESKPSEDLFCLFRLRWSPDPTFSSLTLGSCEPSYSRRSVVPPLFKVKLRSVQSPNTLVLDR